MADVNANIGVNLDASSALAQLKALQRQIATFHSSVAKSSEAATLAQRDLQRNFLNGVNSIGAFSAELRTIKTSAESFTDSLEKNKFSMREYFRYAGASTKTFGKLFRSEFSTIEKVAIENVKRLQTQYIKMGRDANGAMRAIAIMPKHLDMTDLSVKTQIAAQKQAIFNQLIKQGSTNLLNFGKNTQWAGRQLMVGFTLPLAALGSVATKTFMDMETAAIKFKKVYGDLFTPATETRAALDNITELGLAFTKYGIAVSNTVSLAAEAAAAGFQGLDLQRQTTEATRLQVLGQIDAQKALETTISLQNAFQMQSVDLADSINFLNAVENQTVVSLDDITTAIPKAAPVVKQLGGDVKDLAFFMAAMKEGGINASEGANALKSGLASLINPTNKAKEMMAGFGIDIDAIVNKNAGNVKATVIEFAQALDGLSDLNRQRAIEQLFGKFQLARLSTLFENVTKSGNQASRVLDLATASTADLAAIAENELGITADSAMNKFRASVEQLKFSLAPIGELFLEIITPFIKNINNLLEKFNDLSPTAKKVITTLVVGIGGIAPVVLMTIGLFANFVANGIKGLNILRNGYLRLTGQSQILGEQTNYLTVEQQNALAAAHSLEQSHAKLTQTFNLEASALAALRAEYGRALTAANSFAVANPMMMMPGFKPKGYVDGIESVPGPKGAGDIVPAMLSPGEAVISEPMNKKYAPLVQGIIADRIPGFETGVSSVAERFLATRAGRSASGGERAQVNIPGGYQLGHFAEAIQVTGEELRRLAETQSKGFKDTVERMIASVNGDLEHMFDVFTNEVTVQSGPLNQALGEVGSGRLAPKDLFRTEAVQQAGAYNAPVIVKMKEAGASTEEIDNVVQQLATEIDDGITKLGDVTTVTAEQVNQITKEAYDRVSSANEKFNAAREKLKDPGALKEVLGVTAGRTPLKGGYNTKAERKAINEVVQEQIPGLYPEQQAFNFMGPAARKAGIQNAVAIREIFDQLGAEAKSRVIDLLGDIDAMSQQVVLEAKNAGIDLGKYSIQGISEGIEAQSPSQAAKREGQKVVDGFEQGIFEGMDDASLAGQKVGDSAIAGLSGGAPQARAAGAGIVALGMPGMAPHLSKKVDDVSDAMKNNAKNVSVASERMQKFNSRIQAGSFAMMGITSAMSIFGDGTNKVSSTLFKVSTALFAFQSILQVATQAQMLNVLANRAGTAGLLLQNVTSKKWMLNTTLFSGGIKKLLPNLLNFTKIIGRFLGVPGLLIGGFFILKGIIDKINKSKEEERLKVEGLGDAALIAGEKLKGLGEYFGFVPGTFAYETGIGDTAGAIPGAAAQRTAEIQKFVESDTYKKYYAPDVQSIKTATDKEAQLLLENLAMQLIARGAPQEAVSLIIDAIKQQSGKTDLVIDFKSLDLGTKEGKESLNKNVADMLSMFAKKYAKGIGKAFNRNLQFTGKSLTGIFGTLQAQMSAGIITAKDYSDQVNNILSGIDKLKPDAQIKLFDQIFAAMGGQAKLTAANISNLSDKFLYLQAVILGGQNIPKQITDLLSSSQFFLQEMGRRALQKYIEDIFGTTLKNIGGGTTNTNDNGLGDGEKLTKKIIDLLNKQVKALEKKRDALKAVNDEIDRQYEYQQRQMELESQLVEAKISGNYIQAALLTQQKLFEKSQFDRETEELSIQAKIDKINERISEIENGAKLTAAERRLAGLKGKSGGKSGGQSGGQSGGDGDKDEKPEPYESKRKPTKVPDPRPYIKTLSTDKAKTGDSSYTIAYSIKDQQWMWVKRSDVSKDAISWITTDQWFQGKKSFYNGGPISGPGTSTSDSIPIMASDGEYMFSAKAVKNAGGPEAVDAMHQYFRNAPKFKNGGLVAPHDMAMRNQNAPLPKQNWFQRYVSSKTAMEDQMPAWARDPFGLTRILRKFAGQSRKGDNPALAAALLPLNFMGLGAGRGISGGVSKAATIASGASRVSRASLNSAKAIQKEKELMSKITVDDILNNLDEVGKFSAGFDSPIAGTAKWGPLSGKLEGDWAKFPEGVPDNIYSPPWGESRKFSFPGAGKKLSESTEFIPHSIYGGKTPEEYLRSLANSDGTFSPSKWSAASVHLESMSGRSFNNPEINSSLGSLLQATSNAIKYKTILNDLISQGKLPDGTTFKEFMEMLNITGASQVGGRSSDINEITKAANILYAQKYYGLGPEDTMRLYRTNVHGDRIGQPVGWHSVDREMAFSYGNTFSIKGRNMSDVKVKDMPNPFSLSGYTDEFGQILTPSTPVQFSKELPITNSWNTARALPQFERSFLGYQSAFRAKSFDENLLDKVSEATFASIRDKHGLKRGWLSHVLKENPETGLSRIDFKKLYDPHNDLNGSKIIDAILDLESQTGIKILERKFADGGYIGIPKMAMGGYVNMSSLPKFKNGIDNVPYDMPAILHKNERVLTAEENKNYGNSNVTISPTFNITGNNSDEIVNKIMVKLDTLAKKNNKSNKVVS